MSTNTFRTKPAEINSQYEQKRFFNNIIEFSDDSLLEIRVISSSGTANSAFFINYLAAVDYISSIKDKNNVFFGVSSRKDDSSGKKSNCEKLHALFVDIDYGTQGHKKESMFNSKQEVLDFMDKINFPKPSIIIDSGNGLHLYWLLNQPVIFVDDKAIISAESLLKKLSLIFGGDTAYDISRVLRVPGTLNHKTDPPKKCSLLSADYTRKYEMIQLINHPLMQINFENIRNAKTAKHNYYGLLFGNISSFNTDDRSSIDQSLISYLVKIGCTNEDIQLLFDNYPTTGKYSEHNAPIKYLEHSIAKARNYVESDNIIRENYTDNEVSLRMIAPEKLDIYHLETVSDKIGYYIKEKDNSLRRISNFIMELGPRINCTRDDQPYSFYSGKIILENNKIYEFEKFESYYFAESTKFKRFVSNLCGTEIMIYDLYQTIDSVKWFNKNAGSIFEKEYGYDKKLNSYITSELVITSEIITKEYSPIKNQEVWENNQLCFDILTEAEHEHIIDIMFMSLLFWDEPAVMLTLFSFLVYPLIYPYLKKTNPNKFFVMMKGTSGSGKTQLAQWLQNFYGKFHNLFSWTSTSTALNIIGTAFKDALFIVDDLKIQNLRNEKDIQRAMSIIQTYADGTSRQRGRVDLSLASAKTIKGHLLLTAEDVVFTEPSTIARGIILDIKTKITNNNLKSQINEASEKFRGILPRFIQHLMKFHNEDSIGQIFNDARKKVESFNLLEESGVTQDNYSRQVNNFAGLCTAWELFYEYFSKLSPFVYEPMHDQFYAEIKNVMRDNLGRINSIKAEILFERILWESIENNVVTLQQVDPYVDTSGKDFNISNSVGAYCVTKDKEIEMVLSIDLLYKSVRQIAEIGISKGTLITRLQQIGKIEVNNSNRFRIGKTLKRGVKWIGEIPRSVFGLKEILPETTANQDTNE